MRTSSIASLLLAIAVTAANTQALAEEHDNRQYVQHDEWKKGAKIKDEDWKRGERVDYKERQSAGASAWV